MHEAPTSAGSRKSRTTNVCLYKFYKIKSLPKKLEKTRILPHQHPFAKLSQLTRHFFFLHVKIQDHDFNFQASTFSNSHQEIKEKNPNKSSSPTTTPSFSEKTTLTVSASTFFTTSSGETVMYSFRLCMVPSAQAKDRMKIVIVTQANERLPYFLTNCTR